jgi:hypothetical protein
MIAGRLEIELLANVARLSTDMGQAKGIVERAARDMNDAFAQVSTTLKALGVTLSTGAFVGLVDSTIDALDHLNDLHKATDIAVEDLAGIAMAARKSGSDLDGTAKSINMLAQNMGKHAEKFNALGVSARDPLKALQELADQFVALQDPQLRAAVMSEALGRNWQAAAPLLAEGGKRIGELVERGRELSGVTQQMAEQADAVKDKWIDLTGTGRTMIDVVGPLLPLLNSLLGTMIELRDESAKLGGTGGFSLIAEAFRAVVVLAANVAFVFRGVGIEIGGIAAQLAALATGDFKRFAEIGRQMKADAEANRTAFDAWEKGFMSLGTSAAAAGKAIDGSDQVSRRAANDAAARARAFLDTNEKVKKAHQEHTKIVHEDNSELEEAIRIYERLIEMGQRRVQSLQDQVDRASLELDLVGRSNVERALALLQFEKEIALRGVIDEAQRLAIEAKYEELAVMAQLRDAAETELRLWDQLSDVVGHFFADLVTNGRSAFDSLKQYVKDLLKQMIALFAKRWVLNMAAGGSVGGSALDAIAGGTGSDSLVGAGLNAVGSWLGGTATAGSIGAIGSGVFAGGTAGGSVGIGVGASGSFAMGAEGAGMMSGVYEALAAIPVWGWIAMAVIAAVAFFAGKGGGPKVGGSFFQGGAVPGTDNGRFFTPNQGDAQMKAIVEATSGGFLQAFKSLGGSGTPVMNFGLGYDHDPNGSAQSRVSAMLTDAAGKILYNQHDLNMDDKEVPAALQLQAQRMILAALQASDLPKEIADILNSVTADTATSEQIQQAIAAAREMKAVMDALGHLEWGKLDVASLKAMALEGETISQTFQRIAGAMGAFDDAFLSDAQKFERASKHVTDVFASLGIAVPKTTAELVALVHGLDLSTAAGRNMFNMLMSVFPDLQLLFKPDAPDNFTTAVDHATNSVNDFSASLSNPARDLGDWLNKLIQDPNLTTLSLQQRYDQARRDVNSAFRLHDAGGIQSSGQQYLDLAKQLFGQGSPAYTAIFQSFYEQASKLGVGARPFQEAFNAALPKVGTMASSADLNVQTRILGGLLKDVADVVTEAKNEIKGLRKDVKDSTVKPFGA